VILVDTSVWIDHFHRASERLITALEDQDVLTHPFVTGELACGTLRRRQEVLSLLDHLPQALAASDAEIRSLIEGRRLTGRGLGYVDAHLLGSALLTRAQLWTRDRALKAAAATLGVAFEE
jgi:predicted nucleic acid-binding protein